MLALITASQRPMMSVEYEVSGLGVELARNSKRGEIQEWDSQKSYAIAMI